MPHAQTGERLGRVHVAETLLPSRLAVVVGFGILKVVILLGELTSEFLRLALRLEFLLQLDVSALAHPRAQVVLGVVRLAELRGGAIARIHLPSLLGGGDPRRDLGGLLALLRVAASGVRRLLGLALALRAVALANAQGLQPELLADAVGLLEGHGHLAAGLGGLRVDALGERRLGRPVRLAIFALVVIASSHGERDSRATRNGRGLHLVREAAARRNDEGSSATPRFSEKNQAPSNDNENAAENASSLGPPLHSP